MMSSAEPISDPALSPSRSVVPLSVDAPLHTPHWGLHKWWKRASTQNSTLTERGQTAFHSSQYYGRPTQYPDCTAER
ncbi:hypothetical protein HETIRDRAFT_442649 [Heterobasidion irregulare TC 32-1]|uniref:Uncharacterized protein n=1 Tax=Heterobasidion irregulare (strain TC 32-1) TaxID=747525 RepID=W4JP19_HETIT|nr:uncharacterized protein HETIRDRAFT_442649 [Heterobasidion irregulare TC 32-1]ETW74636.1 hypothetical protein HETIRDRAFT_442649 [Heterobasidion irregulare TC 32-1]